MKVAPIPVGARLVDTIQVLGPQTLSALRHGVSGLPVDGVLRYWESLTEKEVQDTLAAGLGLGIVGYSRAPGWHATPGDGTRDAAAQLGRCFELRLPIEGLYQWCDLEGCASPAALCSRYATEFGDFVSSQKGIGGLYVGADQPLTAEELYALQSIHGYWRSQSARIPEPRCGWMMLQLYPSTPAAGVNVDFDVAQTDYRGRQATWIVG